VFDVQLTGAATAISVYTCCSNAVSAATVSGAVTAGRLVVNVAQAQQQIAAALPGMGIRFSHNGTSPMVLNSIGIRCQSSNALKNYWAAYPVNNASLLSSQVRQYRVVSQAMLLSYRGPLLATAGRIAAYNNRGGTSPGNVNQHSLAYTEALKGAYSGEITKGCYGIWEGMDTEAYQFRTAEEDVTEYPYNVFIGSFTGDGSTIPADSIRFKICTNLEIISDVEYFNRKPSRIDRFGEKAEAMIALKKFPQLMENPLHWAAIGNFLKGALHKTFETGKKAYAFYDANKSWINPAVTALTTAAMAV
jgi:hypothetical protein